MIPEVRVEREIAAPLEVVVHQRRRLDFGTEFLFAARDGSTLLTMIQTGLETAELREEHGRGVPNALARLDRAIRARK